jgi:hypothetical protein
MVARDLLALGLTLQPKQEEGDLPGHVIVPEINDANDSDPVSRRRVKELCKSLMDLANKPGATFQPPMGDAPSE